MYSVNPNKGPVFVRENIYSFNSKECPTCISSSESGNVVIIGYSDDSLVIRDVRSQYSEKIWLEVGGHTNTVKSIAFSENDGDFICLSGGSDN